MEIRSHRSRLMSERPLSPPEPVHASEVEDSLDEQIAVLRRSLERESDGANARERDRDQLASRPQRRTVDLGAALRQAARLVRVHRTEVRVYGFLITASLVVAWLISSHLKP
jgi:hypothetical protein